MTAGIDDRHDALNGISASRAVARAVTGPPATVTVLAAFEHAVYLDHPAGLVSLVTADGVHQPNALVMGVPARRRPLAGCHPHQQGRLGAGQLSLGDLRLVVTRWWRPRPSLHPVSAARLRDAVGVAQRHLRDAVGVPPEQLCVSLRQVAGALAAQDHDGAVAAGGDLLGRGPGLTPAGDDVLAGVLAGTQLLTPAVAGADATGVAAATQHAGAALAARAADATTAISAALLHHAARGEVAVPAARVLVALTGGGDVPAAIDGLLQVGSTSGHDLALGLLAAGEVALAAAPRSRRTA